LKKPCQIESLRAVKRIEEMAADGNASVQLVLPMAEMVGWLQRGWATGLAEPDCRWSSYWWKKT
jgi:hypothetical protein